MKLRRRWTLAALAWTLASCAAPSAGPSVWKSPADEAEFQALERRTTAEASQPTRRARLFFLWGQELASQGPDKRDQAIGAFEKVVDLRAGLVDESRFNLEILWRQKQQDQKQNQDQKSQDKPQNQGQNKDKNGQKNPKDNQGKSGTQARPGPQDLSGLVKEKSTDPAVDQALRDDLERRIQAQKEVPQGSVTPVEKDW